MLTVDAVVHSQHALLHHHRRSLLKAAPLGTPLAAPVATAVLGGLPCCSTDGLGGQPPPLSPPAQLQARAKLSRSLTAIRPTRITSYISTYAPAAHAGALYSSLQLAAAPSRPHSTPLVLAVDAVVDLQLALTHHQLQERPQLLLAAALVARLTHHKHTQHVVQAVDRQRTKVGEHADDVVLKGAHLCCQAVLC